ncbi:uncharacterized protein BP5553_05823 [Venustampulla echinocandica]|uniref:histone acetyltransferase n=1 Tax=Venustampulla echinocandica TaxID=2656787 RepID=A0A370TLR5_9HELO|nr:uncharacterized protein BP5553_05823 [Venustampulla echinocandica]RDL36471.1 hypothetical protein BP5553_05823 [Venustampulla echinocandica]
MAGHERINSPASVAIASPVLMQCLAPLLPKDVSFKIYHLSTPPTRTAAIYSAPPGARPDRTYCESHFLSVSIQTPVTANGPESTEVLVYAIETLVYSTAYDTTFFVSKADSTGYLHLLELPKGTPSPLKNITAAFLQYLVEHRERPNIRSVVSLFARAQDQYLFPGSVEYSGKHVLDDRGLVRWWCRVLDPLIQESRSPPLPISSQWDTVKGYLIIPGLDARETMSFIPKRASGESSPWTIGHPLRVVSRHPNDAPPRCLIPHFPDDPKARFLDELDDEVTKGQDSSSGQWRSVKTVEQFWDMMAFRQECSAGRLVGFIWIVLAPKSQRKPAEISIEGQPAETYDNGSKIGRPNDPTFPITPSTSFTAPSQTKQTSPSVKSESYGSPPPSQQSATSSRSRGPSKRKKLTGTIIPREPRAKTQNTNSFVDRSESTPYYSWPAQGRGQIIMDESDYKRITELLLRLDFANLDLAASSSSRWINEVAASGNSTDAWGQTVTGAQSLEIQDKSSAAGVNTLSVGLVRKKRKGGPEDSRNAPLVPTVDVPTPSVNVLGANMIKKKKATA